MLVLIAIAAGWLMLAVLFATVCGMAARGDAVPPPLLLDASIPSAAEELLLWEGLGGPELRDARTRSGAHAGSLVAHTG